MKRLMIVACCLLGARVAAAAPTYIHGQAWIKPGARSVLATHSRIEPASRVFLTVSTTDSWDPRDLVLPGVRLDQRRSGALVVSTLDQSVAHGTSGIPVEFLVVNQPSGVLNSGSYTNIAYTTGSGTIPANAYNVGVTAPTTTTSTILLTVDATGVPGGQALPGVKINNKGNGWFTVTTLGLQTAPSAGLKFNWMVINGNGAPIAGAGANAVPSGAYNTGVTASPTRATSGVFLTVDSTTIPGSDVALPGVKINNHGDGWFTVTTLGNTLAPTTTVPFDYFVAELPETTDTINQAYAGDEFTIEVGTGNIDYGGTDAKVYVQLFNPYNGTGKIELDNPDRDDFVANTVDTFVVATRMGTPADWVGAIGVWHDNSGNNPGWYLDYIKVRDDRTGRTKVFTFDRWLATSEGDHSIHLYKSASDDTCSGLSCTAVAFFDAPAPPPAPPPNQCPGTNVVVSVKFDQQARADNGYIQYLAEDILLNHTGSLTSLTNSLGGYVYVLTSDGNYFPIAPSQTATMTQIFGGNLVLPVHPIVAIQGTVGPTSFTLQARIDCI